MRAGMLPVFVSVQLCLGLSVCVTARADSGTSPASPEAGAKQSFRKSVNWICSFGSEYTDNIDAVTCDAFGNIYVVGGFSATEGDDFGYLIQSLRKYTRRGVLAWKRHYGADAGGSGDQAVTTDGAGNVYAAGGFRDWAADSASSYLVKYDRDGGEIWRKALNLDLRRMRADADGNLYAVGRTVRRTADPLKPEAAASLRKLRATGEESWTRVLVPEVNELTMQVAPGPDGLVYVAGSVQGALPGQSAAGGWDLFVRVYTGAGDEVWTRQFGTDKDEFFQDAVVDGTGNITVAYFDENPSLIRLDASGAKLWTMPLDTRVKYCPTCNMPSIALAMDQGHDVDVLLSQPSPQRPGREPGETIYVPDHADVRRLDATGAVVWFREFPSWWAALPSAIASDGRGNVYLGGDNSEWPLDAQVLGAPSYEIGYGEVFLLRLKP